MIFGFSNYTKLKKYSPRKNIVFKKNMKCNTSYKNFNFFNCLLNVFQSFKAVSFWVFHKLLVSLVSDFYKYGV